VTNTGTLNKLWWSTAWRKLETTALQGREESLASTYFSFTPAILVSVAHKYFKLTKQIRCTTAIFFWYCLVFVACLQNNIHFFLFFRNDLKTLSLRDSQQDSLASVKAATYRDNTNIIHA
jgi:hypothetical protein